MASHNSKQLWRQIGCLRAGFSHALSDCLRPEGASTIQSAVGVERQLAKRATFALTYINSYGEHQVFFRNANAPFPGTYPPGIRPFGDSDNIYQYDSEGIFRQNQLIANFRTTLEPNSHFSASTRSTMQTATWDRVPEGVQAVEAASGRWWWRRVIEH